MRIEGQGAARLHRAADILSLAAPLALYSLHALLFAAYVNDDAYITFRYSHFLAHGLGPYYNVGEHVEGYTNFLHMLFLAIIDALCGDAALPLAAKAIGFAAGSAAIGAAYALTKRLTGDRASAALAAAFIAVTPGYALNSMNGLETTLYAALLTIGVWLGEEAEARQRWRGAGIAFAAAVLTRPEGLGIFGAYWLASILVSPNVWLVRRRLAVDAGIVALAVVLQLAFRLIAYDGEWLPNTYFAKLGGSRMIGAWDYVRDGALVPFGGAIAATAAALAALLKGQDRKRILVAAAPVVAGVLSPFVIGTDWMLGQRFEVPYLPLLAVIVASGWHGALRIALSGASRTVVYGVLIATLWVTQDRQRVEDRRFVTINAPGYRDGHAAMARWLGTQSREGEWVALMDIGIVGFTLPKLRILDLSGLTDRFIARSPGGFLSKDYDVSYVLSKQPRFVVLVFFQRGDPMVPPHPGEVRGPWTAIEKKFLDDPGFRRNYRVERPPETNDWLDSIAAALGARRVFHHVFTDGYYYLAVFERQSIVE